jgi:molybdopterin converting factor small subunit
MRLHVLLFGPLAEIYGAREEWLDLGNSPTAADVYHHYRRRDARIGQLEKSLHIAVNQSVVRADHALAPEDEVALLPPVCGGSGISDPSDPNLIDLTEAPLENYSWRKHLGNSAGNFGAVVSFEGLVRQEDTSDPVTALRRLSPHGHRRFTRTR